jgi:hypothetical protein
LIGFSSPGKNRRRLRGWAHVGAPPGSDDAEVAPGGPPVGRGMRDEMRVIRGSGDWKFPGRSQVTTLWHLV